MKQLIPYLNFNGQCEAALRFYQSCFDDVELSMRTFGDLPQDDTFPVDDEAKNKVMHAEFKTDGLMFMASDGQPQNPWTLGNNIHLNLQLESVDEQDAIFTKLSAGGQVVMPLEETFWQARFGMLIDKFGIQWMLNVPLG